MRKESSVLKNIGKRRQNNIGKLGQIKMLAINANILVITVNVNRAKLSNQIKERNTDTLEKAEEPEFKLPTSVGSLKKQENFRKTSTTSSLTTLDHNKLWKILKEMGIPDHLTCLLRNLYTGKEATVRTRHATIDCFKIGKRVHQGYILSPCLFNLFAGYIM